MRKKKWLVSIFVFVELAFAPCAIRAQTGEPRLAFVIGNSQYRSVPLATSVNDAGLIAQTLTTAGFDVTGASDLDQDSMRRAFRDFLNKVQAAGPHAITFVYLAGYGLQYSGENYFVPVDAALQRDTDIPVEAIRISDFTHALAGFAIDARVFVLDAAHGNPFPLKGNPIAGGLALPAVEEGTLEAFDAAPGTVAPSEQGPYGAYARALAEMLRYGGAPIDEVFARARLRVNELTHGALLPWDESKLTRPLILLAGNPEAVAMPAMQDYTALRSRHIRDFPDPAEAYAAAIEIDSFAAYQEFLVAYPSDPLAKRVRAILAARREALTWERTVAANTPDAYWSYMRRYPRGPHYFDARRRLGPFAVSLEPPPRFDPYDFQGLPPPPEDEYVIVDRPVIIFEGPDYPPAPPPPPGFLPPPPPEFRRLPPPRASAGGGLPAPAEALPLPFATPAARQGSFSQPNLTAPATNPAAVPAAGALPNAQAPNTVAPSGQAVPPGTAPTHALPAVPQVQPGAAAPAVLPRPTAPPAQQPVQPGAVEPQHPAGATPTPLTEPQGAVGHLHPAGGANPASPAAAPQVQPGVAAPAAQPVHPQAEPAHPAAVPAAPAPAPALHVEPPHPAAAPPPHVEPHAAAPAPVPHVEPPHPAAAPPPHIEPPHPAAAPAAPPPAPHVEPPHPAAPPAAPHPAAPPHVPKPEEKPGEQH